MRHGKAEAFAQEDHRRRLTDRGRREATAAGEWLAENGIVPNEAFVSSATRTRQTWEALVAGSGTPAEARVEDAVYSADADSALDVLRNASADAEVVLYVGHNPTAASLAHLLDDGNPDPDAFRAMSAGFPTAATAVLEISVPWAELGPATGHLIAFHVGRA
ncbi:MAG: Phosphoglycerate mutase [Marmoricola sp.]|nr:Phosphoglycerate mutase [Marmoricola sp.]